MRSFSVEPRFFGCRVYNQVPMDGLHFSDQILFFFSYSSFQNLTVLLFRMFDTYSINISTLFLVWIKSANKLVSLSFYFKTKFPLFVRHQIVHLFHFFYFYCSLIILYKHFIGKLPLFGNVLRLHQNAYDVVGVSG